MGLTVEDPNTAAASVAALVLASRGAPMAPALPGGGDYLFLAEAFLAKAEATCVAVVFDHSARVGNLPPHDPRGYVLPPMPGVQ